LFIALMLEGLVEWMHHRHLVAEARENIRVEITTNAKQADRDLVSLKQTEDLLMKNLVQLAEIQSAHRFGEHRALKYALEWERFSDSAWSSARDTGALSFMPYKQVQDMADVYGKQNLINTTAGRVFEELPKSLAPIFIAKDPSQTSQANLDRIQTRTADVLTSVRVLEEVVTQLQKQYQDALQRM